METLPSGRRSLQEASQEQISQAVAAVLVTAIEKYRRFVDSQEAVKFMATIARQMAKRTDLFLLSDSEKKDLNTVNQRRLSLLQLVYGSNFPREEMFGYHGMIPRITASATQAENQLKLNGFKYKPKWLQPNLICLTLDGLEMSKDRSLPATWLPFASGQAGALGAAFAKLEARSMGDDMSHDPDARARKSPGGSIGIRARQPVKHGGIGPAKPTDQDSESREWTPEDDAEYGSV